MATLYCYIPALGKGCQVRKDILGYLIIPKQKILYSTIIKKIGSRLTKLIDIIGNPKPKRCYLY